MVLTGNRSGAKQAFSSRYQLACLAVGSCLVSSVVVVASNSSPVFTVCLRTPSQWVHLRLFLLRPSYLLETSGVALGRGMLCSVRVEVQPCVASVSGLSPA